MLFSYGETRRRVARLLLFTFGIDSLAPISIWTARAVLASAAAHASSRPVAAQTLSACDAALVSGMAPTAGASASRLWPPDHSLVDIGFSAATGPACAGVASLRVRVYSDEPAEDQTGDGNHVPDAALAPAPGLLLRAERKGNADGRVYLVLTTATSPSGATNTVCSAVGVAKSQAKRDRDSLGAQLTGAQFYCSANDAAPAGFHLLLDSPWNATPINQPPQVSAGSDASIAFGGTATLGGSATDDGLPSNTLTALWTVVSGPGSVTFGDPAALSTTAMFSASGAYTLRLTVSDGALSGSDDVGVTVGQQNMPPVVSAGPDRAVTLPETSTTLNGLVSDDGLPSGSLSVQWTLVSGPGTVTFGTPSSPTTLATFSTEGTYTLRLTGSDGALSASDDVQVIVHPPENAPPSASAGPDLTLTLPATTAALNGAVADDGLPTGVLTALWTQVSGPSGATIVDPTSPSTTVVVAEPGVYVFRLTANDGALSASDDTTLGVSPAPNLAPVVDAGPDIEIRLPATAATLLGSATDDGQPAGTLTTSWSVVSGAGAVSFEDAGAASTNVTIDQPGTYVLRLTASDSILESSDDVTVHVLAEPPPGASIDDATFVEGNNGRHAVTATVRLSRPSLTTVTIDFVTAPASAGEGCDFEVAFGTVTFGPGVTELPVTVFINGDLLQESEETFEVRIGNPVGATIQDAAATVSLQDDDAANDPPARPSGRTPAAVSIEQPQSTVLGWTASTDPQGDAVAYDVEFATTLRLDTQQWLASCAASTGPGPGPRSGSASAYADGADRMFVFGGTNGTTDVGDLWVLDRASMSGGNPSWTELAIGGGPSPRRLAHAAYDPHTDTLAIAGGCTGDCSSPLTDAWMLTGASTTSPAWVALPALPQARAAAASAFDESSGRWFLGLGRSATGLRNDVIAIDVRSTTPSWTLVNATGIAPEAAEGATAAYDPTSERLVFFGGLRASGASRDVHAIANVRTSPQWMALAPVGSQPPGRYGHAFHYDPITDRAVLFGGTTAGVATNTNFVAADAWILSGVRTGTPLWERLTTDFAPTGRFNASTALSPSENRFIVLLGENNKIGLPALDDAAVLTDALGAIDNVSANQPASSYAPTLTENATHYWRVVARDDKGAIAGSRPFVLSTGLPSLRVLDLTAPEGSAGNATVSVPVVLSRPSEEIVTVAYEALAAIGADAATPDVDFTPVSGVLTFQPGETAQSIEIPVLGDFVHEGDERVSIILSGPSGATLAIASATLTIQNDDQQNTPPVVSAGSDFVLALPALSATLQGVATDDGVPTPLTTTWSFVSGPGGVTFDDAASPETGVSFEVAGDYVLRLTADDGLVSSFDEVAVYVRAAADLTISALETSGVSYNAESLTIQGAVSVTVANLSSAGQPLPFDVTIFEDRNANGRFDATLDVLLGRSTIESLAGGGIIAASVELSGAVLFAGNVIHATVDALAAVAETNEANNTADTAPTCAPGPPPTSMGPMSVVVERTWTSSPIEPGSRSVIMTPAVADLTGDGVPEIVFVTHPVPNPNQAVAGRLRAIDGATGVELFGVKPPNVTPTVPRGLHGLSQIAVGDLDGDALPEIIAFTDRNEVQAFRRDGTPWWTSAVITGRTIWYGGPALVDLDQDGRPEILAGNRTLNWDGTFRGPAATTWGDYLGLGGLPIAADLDLDGVPEVIRGSNIYRADGSLAFSARATPTSAPLPDGFNAVGNFDADPEPEVVLVTNGTLYVVSHTGVMQWFRSIPGGRGGPPTVGDFDGDGLAEIGIASLTAYTVWENDGTQKWTKSIVDPSGATGSSLFDFEGDGSVEVVYADSTHLRVFRGIDGEIRLAHPLNNGTGYELPVIADVDGDQNAEIIGVRNNTLSGTGPEGLVILGAQDDSWVSTRKVWHQHAYDIGNVNDDLTIPTTPAPSWTTHNSYRAQALPLGGCAFVRPDLVPSFARKLVVPAGLQVTVRIGNAGNAVVPAGASIAFRNGSASGPRIDTVVTAIAIAPSTFLDVSTILPLGASALPLVVVADDPVSPGVSNVESNEVNNALETRIFWGGAFNAAPAVDAGPDQTLSDTQSLTTISASFTDDGLPGPPVLVSWGQVSGPSTAVIADPSAATSPLTVSEPGTYVFRASAFDRDLSGFDEVTIVKTAPNTGPAVDAGPDQEISTGNTVLAGSVTDDGLPLSSTIAIQWTQTAGPVAAIADPASQGTAVNLPANGVYRFRITANDGEFSAQDEVEITVFDSNTPPAVDAGADQAVTTTSATLSAAFVDDGRPTNATPTVTWTQIAGPAIAVIADATSSSTGVTLVASGTYVFRATVSDGELSGSDTTSITLTPEEGSGINAPPVVNAGTDQTLTLPTTITTLDGAVTDDALPTATLSTQWTQVAGPAAVAIASPSSPSSQITLPVAGTYVFRLAATDSQASASDDVTIVVQPATPTGSAPQITITSPAEGAAITAPTDFVGSILSSQLLDWKLEIKERQETTYRTIATGNTEVTNGVITTFDPTGLLNGMYDLRFVARDMALRTTTLSQTAVAKDNLKVGQFSVSFVDLEVPVAGMPIRVTRTYDSRDKSPGDFGYGWRLDMSNVKLRENGQAATSFTGTVIPGFFPTYCLNPVRPQVVTLTLPGSEVLEFEPKLTPSCQPFGPISVATVSYVPRAGSRTQGTLVPVGGARVLVWGVTGPVQLFDEETYDFFDPEEYILTLPDGREFTVHQTTGLRKIKDLNGNVLTVTSSGIQHSAGRSVTFARDAQGRITTVTDPAGFSQTYAYDANGDLETHTDRETNVTTFSYLANPAHHLEDIRDPLGRTPIRNDYYPDGRIQRHTDAYGKTIEYAHDVTGRQEEVVDREGNLRVLHYDDRGNVTKEVGADAKQVLRTFDARNNRLTETEPHEQTNLDPPTSTWTFDARDNVLTQEDPLGNRTEYTYNARNQVLTTKDARGKTTTNVYDTKGNLTSTTDANNSTTTFGYDANGNLLTQSQTVNGVVETTTNGYDAFGQLTSETDALGRVTTHTYDNQGNRKTETRTRTLPGGGTETLTTNYTYDRNGRLTKTTDPDGTFTETTYDAAGRQATTKDKLGRVTTFAYDFMGRLERTTYPDTTFETSTYDGEGRRLTSTDRAGRTTTYDYDDVGRLTKTTFASDATTPTAFTENVYDSAGRLVQTKDARGKTTTYEYDSAGRRTSVTLPPVAPAQAGAQTVFTYDANGNQKTIKDANNNTTTYEYDDLNRRTKTVFPDATFTETTYDEAGRRTSERDQAGKLTSFTYDKLGRLTSVIPAQAGIQPTTYTYDEVGNRLTQTDANGNTTRFEYDRLGRETARILPDGAREEKTYDANGNLKTAKDFLGRVTTYDYDVNNRLETKVLPPSGSGTPAGTHAFTYTPTGRRQTATDARGVTTWTYDVRDRVTSLVQPLTATATASLAYTYDANGNRESIAATVGSETFTTTYGYDDLSRLTSATSPAGAITLGYDDAGNRTSLNYPNGVETAYTFNALNRLTNLSATKGINTIQSYAFTLGPSGNRTQIAEAFGQTKTYTYDDLYRLLTESSTSPTLAYSKVFTYDPVGNRETQSTTIPTLPVGTTNLVAGSETLSYDTRDRLLSVSPSQAGAQPSVYTYDTNGNVLTKSSNDGATYTWDKENRLIQVSMTDGRVIDHVYDVDGNRVRTTTTIPGAPATVTTQNYLVDTTGGLSHVVAEADGSGTPQVFYVRATDELVALARPTGPGTFTAKYFHADGIGSIRKLTDSAGTITDSYEYTAFGERILHIGTDVQPYAFTGEPLDPNSGFQYHRARWMDPRSGRFGGVDPFAGGTFDPRSLHKYVYAAADPGNAVDPSGLAYSQDFGRAVEQKVQEIYRSTHAGDRTTFGDRLTRIFDRASGAFDRWDIKPDIMNFHRRTYMEVKPLSLSGIGKGIAQMDIYDYVLEPYGYHRGRWQPPITTMTSVGPVGLLEVDGIIFYTDVPDLMKHAKHYYRSLPGLRRLLRVGQAAASGLNEFAKVSRLASIGASASQGRLSSQFSLATIVSTLSGGLL